MTAQEIKVKGSSNITVGQFIVSIIGLLVLITIAVLSYFNSIQARINYDATRISVIEVVQNSNQEWRKDVTKKLEDISAGINELKVSLANKKDR